jgi:hypothetical protein
MNYIEYVVRVDECGEVRCSSLFDAQKQYDMYDKNDELVTLIKREIKETTLCP